MRRWLVAIAFFGSAGLSLVMPPDEAPPARTLHEDIDFTHDVLPVLAKAGCSAANCHGGATGRGGFKLSLFGTDPRGDHRAIAFALGGRRVDFANPEQSLILRKPTLSMKHGGGRRLTVGDDAYTRLSDWIGAGAPWGGGRVVERLELREEGDRVRALAFFRGEAQARDVTGLTRFMHTADDRWIIARYAGAVARQRTQKPEPTVTGARPGPHGIARRLWLDLAGRTPTPEELRAFVERPDPITTARRLVGSADYRRTMQSHFEEWLEIPHPSDERTPTRARNARLRAAVSKAIEENEKLFAFIDRLLAKGPTGDLLGRFNDPRDRAEFVGRAFLGVQIGCARCHNHPDDRWKQTDHLGWSAHFVDPRPRAGGGMQPGTLYHPTTGQPIARSLPFGSGSPFYGTTPLHHVRWMLRTDARAVVAVNLANRVASWILRRPFVDPVGDHRVTNPGTRLDAHTRLTATLVQTDGDLARVVVETVSLKEYGQAADPWALDPLTYRRTVRSALGLPDSAERLPTSPLARELRVINGELVHGSLREPGNAVDVLFAFGGEPKVWLDELWMMTLSRPPRPDEVKRFLPVLLEADDRPAAGRDLAAALLLCAEFAERR